MIRNFAPIRDMFQKHIPQFKEEEFLNTLPGLITMEDMKPYRAQNHGMGGCIDTEMMTYTPRMLYAFEPTTV